MTLRVVLATTILGLALAGCSGDADPASEAASGIPSAVTSPQQSPGETGDKTLGASEAAEASAAAQAACGQRTTPRPELARQLLGVPTLVGWQPIEVANQGRTRAVSGALRGTVDDLVTVRDNAADELVSTGYNQTESDEEVGHEAEAEFEGPHEVRIKVKPLCRDYLVLTYTVRQ